MTNHNIRTTNTTNTTTVSPMSLHNTSTNSLSHTNSTSTIDPPSEGDSRNDTSTSCAGSGGLGGGANDSSDDAATPLQSPRSQNTSREEEDEDSSNANNDELSDCKSPGQRCVEHDADDEQDDERPLGDESGSGKSPATQSWRNLRAVMAYYHTLRKIKRTKSNQRWMKLRTTVQISSAMQSKKPPLKREDSFLQRFSTRQIPETQETVEDTGSEGGTTERTTTRRRRARRKQPRTVVNPDENFYFYWLLILTLSVLYNLWTLIVRQSFPEFQTLLSGFWLGCDCLSDLCFILDVVVQLRTGYLEQGLMVYDSRKLAKHYLTSRAFLLDLAALCPLDLLQFHLGPQPLLRFPRFFKVYRAINYYYMVESRTVYPNLWRVVNLIHILLILAHWFGCFYFLLSEAEGFQGDWVYPYRPGDYATLTRKYLGSLYWSTLTLTTIGDLPTPETNAEKTNSVDGPRSLPRRGVKSRLLQFNNNEGYVFTIVSYLIGVFIFATIVGQVGNVITNRNANRLEFERLLDGAKTYMRHHKVPGGMKRRVLRWYDYSWSRGRIQGGGDINTALGLLPDKLKTELALHVNLSVLKKVTIFQECQPEFLRDLVLKMRAYIFTPGDSICRKGEVAREMFIIADGILEVLSEAGKVLTSMKAGDFFGEIGILNLDGLNKRTADVRSVGYSELFSLSREDVLNAMKDYPEAQEILQALGRKRLMEVKASARQYQKEKDMADGKGLVDKIKNEAKGLRNALRKSRTHRRSQESLELQPLHISRESRDGKGVLKRMPRVRSHELSQEEDKKESEIDGPEKVTSPLGAGLPLLSRLRLLKEKQEHEERVNSSPGQHSTSPASIKSPPPTGQGQGQNIGSSSSGTGSEEQPEVIGAGLPLLQRLLLLKAKEDKAQTLQNQVQGQGQGSGVGPGPQSPNLASTSNTATSVFNKTLGVAKPGTKVSFRDKLKQLKEIKENKEIKDVAPHPVHQPLKDIPEPSVEESPKDSPRSGESLDKDEKDENAHWIKLKKAAIVSDKTMSASSSLTNLKKSFDGSQKSEPGTGQYFSSVSGTGVSGVCGVPGVAGPAVQISSVPAPGVSAVPGRPKLILTERTKHYRSIDDLSPEYGGLPFVKKLKILNERQKLEELETVMKTRSFSLDISDKEESDHDHLTRSRSEGSTMHQAMERLLVPSPLHSSTESNETLERRNLKSILKKLSEEVPPTSTVMPEKRDSTEFRKLMRAPTIEGYAARHSKLSKSVTFNRDTLPSPPNSGGLTGTSLPGIPGIDTSFPFLTSPIITTTTSLPTSPLVKTLPDAGTQVRITQGLPGRPFQTCGTPGFQSGSPGVSPELSGATPGVPQISNNISNLTNITVTNITSVIPPTTQAPQVSQVSPMSPPVFSPTPSNGTSDNNNIDELKARLEAEKQDKCNVQIITSKNNQMKYKGSLDEEQQYFADILMAIKQVMSTHLQDMQEKYQQKLLKLEEELKERDETIDQLREHIYELEKATDDSYTDSIETVVSGHDHDHSWEELNRNESTELNQLPQTLCPQPIWQGPTDEVILEMDSNTDTESEFGGDSSEPEPGYESGEYENSSSNWEVEMLAAEMRQRRRSASLDPSATRPIRRRFTRGASADTSGSASSALHHHRRD